VAKQSRPDEREAAPQRFAEVPPPAYSQNVGATYLAETVMQMQQSLGELKSDVRHLKESVDGHGKKLDRISHIIFAASVVATIFIAIGGFAISKLVDVLLSK
jgi:hypothetical protein